MGYGLYLNFEKVSMDIIENNIKEMTENNLFTYDEDVPDETNEKIFMKNLYHGSIAITFIVNLLETSMNTILSKRLGIVKINILKYSTFKKIKYICDMCNVDFKAINKTPEVKIMRKAMNLRNDITHYKNNVLGEGTFVTADAKIPMGLTKKPMAAEFTKSKMQEYYDNTINLIKIICNYCGYKVNSNCRIIDCDGCDDEYEYII